jgi:hypothetical protein
MCTSNSCIPHQEINLDSIYKENIASKPMPLFPMANSLFHFAKFFMLVFKYLDEKPKLFYQNLKISATFADKAVS